MVEVFRPSMLEKTVSQIPDVCARVQLPYISRNGLDDAE